MFSFCAPPLSYLMKWLLVCVCTLFRKKKNADITCAMISNSRALMCIPFPAKLIGPNILLVVLKRNLLFVLFLFLSFASLKFSDKWMRLQTAITHKKR